MLFFLLYLSSADILIWLSLYFEFFVLIILTSVYGFICFCCFFLSVYSFTFCWFYFFDLDFFKYDRFQRLKLRRFLIIANFHFSIICSFLFLSFFISNKNLLIFCFALLHKTYCFAIVTLAFLIITAIYAFFVVIFCLFLIWLFYHFTAFLYERYYNIRLEPPFPFRDFILRFSRVIIYATIFLTIKLFFGF